VRFVVNSLRSCGGWWSSGLRLKTFLELFREQRFVVKLILALGGQLPFKMVAAGAIDRMNSL